MLSYARGWWVRKAEFASGPVLNIFHSGLSEDGFNAWFSRYPDRGVSLIYASQQSWEGVPLREALFAAGPGPGPLESILFGGPVVMPPPVTRTPDLSRLAGRYRLEGGAWVDVEIETPFLRLTPHGQAAFDRFIPAGSPADAPAVLGAATTRTQAILAALVEGDGEPFRKATGGRTDGYELPPPAVSRFEVLGSYPVWPLSATRRSAVTHVLITSGGATRHYHFSWDDESLGGVWADDQPTLPRFRAVGPMSFANLHPLQRTGARVSFDGDVLLMGSARARREP